LQKIKINKNKGTGECWEKGGIDMNFLDNLPLINESTNDNGRMC